MNTPYPLHYECLPKMPGARMVIALDGWMDGGEVSTGTVGWLIDRLGAGEVAKHMDPDPFYLVNFPGSMEVTAMFRPYVDITDGIISTYQEPTNTFFASPEHNLILFQGEEPNNAWQLYTDCVFHVAKEVGVGSVYFIGSFGGVVPHARAEAFRHRVGRQDQTRPGSPGDQVQQLRRPRQRGDPPAHPCADAGLTMANLSAEIPAYIEGLNAKSIEAVARKLAVILDLNLNFDKLRKTSDRWERKLNKAVAKKDELLEHIQKLEEDYDHEVFDTQMGDLKDFLKKAGRAGGFEWFVGPLPRRSRCDKKTTPAFTGAVVIRDGMKQAHRDSNPD